MKKARREGSQEKPSPGSSEGRFQDSSVGQVKEVAEGNGTNCHARALERSGGVIVAGSTEREGEEIKPRGVGGQKRVPSDYMSKLCGEQYLPSHNSATTVTRGARVTKVNPKNGMGGGC